MLNRKKKSEFLGNTRLSYQVCNIHHFFKDKVSICQIHVKWLLRLLLVKLDKNVKIVIFTACFSQVTGYKVMLVCVINNDKHFNLWKTTSFPEVFT